MRWRIYYGDPGGMVYDGDCADHAYRAPNLGVQVYKEECRIEIDKRGYTIRKECAWFCWVDAGDKIEGVVQEPISRWSGKNDKAGLYDYIFHKQGPMKILTGREICDEVFQRVMKKVNEDGNFEEMNFQPGKRHRG